MRLAAILICTILSFNALADDISIVDARRNIPLSDEEPAFKDFYLNAGEGSGLKKNLVVNVVRKWSVRDAAGAQAIGEIEAPVGQIKVIAVYGRVAVAREYKLPMHDDIPMIEQAGIMIGDKIDLKGSFTDEKTFAAKRRAAEAAAAKAAQDAVAATQPQQPTPPVAATPTQTPAPAQTTAAAPTQSPNPNLTPNQNQLPTQAQSPTPPPAPAATPKAEAAQEAGPAPASVKTDGTIPDQAAKSFGGEHLIENAPANAKLASTNSAAPKAE